MPMQLEKRRAQRREHTKLQGAGTGQCPCCPKLDAGKAPAAAISWGGAVGERRYKKTTAKEHRIPECAAAIKAASWKSEKKRCPPGRGA